MELFVKQELLKLLPGLDALLLDIDGVLLDVSGSFRQVIAAATQEFATRFLELEDSGPLLTPGEVELFKLAGGFNDDWELCCAAVALVVAKWAQTNARDTQTVRNAEPSWADYTRELKRRRSAMTETTGLAGAEAFILERLNPTQRRDFARQWNTRLVTQLCEEMYGGEMCRALYGHDPQYVTEGENFGLYRRETPIVQRELLDAVHGKVRLGLLTGRSDAETSLAMRELGLQLPKEALLTSSSGLKKPDGKTLLQLRDQMEFKAALFVGDTLDDLRTVQNYRELRGAGKSRVYSAIALSGPGGSSARRQFLEAGAEVVAPDVNTILEYLGAVLK